LQYDLRIILKLMKEKIGMIYFKIYVERRMD
jgi:hypothetical protein